MLDCALLGALGLQDVRGPRVRPPPLSLLSPEQAFQCVKSLEYGLQVFQLFDCGPSAVQGLGTLQILRHRRTCRGRPVFITERHEPQLPSPTFIDDDKVTHRNSNTFPLF
jgi:hypothetical protein